MVQFRTKTLDHLGRAKDLRQRATSCIESSKLTTSSAFKDCYKLLAINYLLQARLEENFVEANDKGRSYGGSS
jgi:hypothetical protein